MNTVLESLEAGKADYPIIDGELGPIFESAELRKVLFQCVCEALVTGTVGEISRPANLGYVLGRAQDEFHLRCQRINLNYPKHIEVFMTEIRRVNLTKYRERMWHQYKYLVETNQELKDLDLEKMGGVY